MSRKQSSKGKRRNKALPVLSVAGLSLSLASSVSAAPIGPVADITTRDTGENHELTFSEEEIADVSLATFYVFDKETGGGTPDVQLVGHGCGGCHACGGCHGCGGCGGCGHGCSCHGCGGCHGCGCVNIWWSVGCGGAWWGGCSGCSGGYWCWRNGRRVWCVY